MSFSLRPALVALGILTAASCGDRQAWAGPPLRRIAVVVGANDAPPGRLALRFAHDDASEVADVLRRAGDFSDQDVHVMLDPHPAELLAALDDVRRAAQRAGGEVLFVFYYSGHSDGQSLFPHGEPAALSDIHAGIDRLGARIRVGILDTCRGGAWTQSKGLSVGPPLADLLNVETEGTALVSSSAGLEDAHEAEAVRGSIFTHHLVAGLRGAADRAGDANVTLQEAFEYAKERTVRDSARLAKTPQHPSFDLALRGRQDIVLTVLSGVTAALAWTITRGSVEIIHLPSGVTVADAPPDERSMRIVVAPGRYLVRTTAAGRVYAKEVEVRAGEVVSVDDAQLAPSGTQPLALKGGEPEATPLALSITPPARWWTFQIAPGISDLPQAYPQTDSGSAGTQASAGLERHYAEIGSLAYGITDRLSVALPVSLMYRLGDPEGAEVITRAGVRAWGHNDTYGWWLEPMTAIGVRLGSRRGTSFVATAAAMYFVLPSASHYDYLGFEGSAGFETTLRGIVTFHFGAALGGNIRPDRLLPGSSRASFGGVAVGSPQELGVRSLPLIEAHVSRKLSIDVLAWWTYEFASKQFSDAYLAGITWSF